MEMRVAEKLKELAARPEVKAFLRHPASWLAWVVLFSIAVKENYPFSHFPMYSGFSSRTYFYYFEQEGEPIEAKRIFKTSIPRSKKLMGNYKDEVEDARKDAEDEEIEREAAKMLLAYLRETTTQKEKYAEILGKPITVMRKNIEFVDGEFLMEDLTIVTD
ncbi:MAG: hypothetical protein AAGA58_00885 [Verrucomicrobiota bacterium]